MPSPQCSSKRRPPEEVPEPPSPTQSGETNGPDLQPGSPPEVTATSQHPSCSASAVGDSQLLSPLSARVSSKDTSFERHFSPLSARVLTAAERRTSVTSEDARAAIEDIQKMIKKSSWVLRPVAENKRLRQWELLCGLCLLFVVFMTPYEVAFLISGGVDALFVINRVVDICFMIDMVLQFVTIQEVRLRHSTSYILNHRKIARRYLKSWFIIDFMSVLPVDFIGLMVNSEDVSKLRIFRQVRLFRLVKLARLLRGAAIFQRWQIAMTFSYRKLTLLKLCAQVILAAHWTACVIGLTTTLNLTSCYVTAYEPGCTLTWLDDAYHKDIDTPFGTYLVAMWVAFTVLVHPHAFEPKSAVERLIFILLILLGGFIWTSVISKSTAIARSLNMHSMAHHQLLDELNRITAELSLDTSLRKRLRVFFLSKGSAHNETWKNIFAVMSPELQKAVSYELNRSWILGVRFFCKCNTDLRAEIAQGLITRNFAQAEMFGSPLQLYIMVRGLGAKFTGGGGFHIRNPGSVWGEEHLLLTAWWLLDPTTSMSMTFTEVLTLDRHVFQRICEDHQEVKFILRQWYLRIALRQGLFHEARKRKAELRADLLAQEALVRLRNEKGLENENDESEGIAWASGTPVRRGGARKASLRNAPANFRKTMKKVSLIAPMSPMKDSKMKQEAANKANVTLLDDQTEAESVKNTLVLLKLREHSAMREIEKAAGQGLSDVTNVQELKLPTPRKMQIPDEIDVYDADGAHFASIVRTNRADGAKSLLHREGGPKPENQKLLLPNGAELEDHMSLADLPGNTVLKLITVEARALGSAEPRTNSSQSAGVAANALAILAQTGGASDIAFWAAIEELLETRMSGFHGKLERELSEQSRRGELRVGVALRKKLDRMGTVDGMARTASGMPSGNMHRVGSAIDAPWLRPSGTTLPLALGQPPFDPIFGIDSGSNLQHLSAAASLAATSTARDDAAGAMCRTPAVLQRPEAKMRRDVWLPTAEGMQSLPSMSERLRRGPVG